MTSRDDAARMAANRNFRIRITSSAAQTVPAKGPDPEESGAVTPTAKGGCGAMAKGRWKPTSVSSNGSLGDLPPKAGDASAPGFDSVLHLPGCTAPRLCYK